MNHSTRAHLSGGGRLCQRHLDHSLPHVSVRPARRHLEQGRLVQAGSAGLGEDRPVRRHAEDGVAALETHLFVPHAVVKLHCVGGEREKESIRKFSRTGAKMLSFYQSSATFKDAHKP